MFVNLCRCGTIADFPDSVCCFPTASAYSFCQFLDLLFYWCINGLLGFFAVFGFYLNVGVPVGFGVGTVEIATSLLCLAMG
jgi:hypothetical protein